MREDLGISQTILAEILGVNRTSVALEENGRQQMSTLTYRKLGYLREWMEAHHANKVKEEVLRLSDEARKKHVATICKKLATYEAEKEKLQKELTDLSIGVQRAATALKLLQREMDLFEGLEVYTDKLKFEYRKIERTLTKSDFNATHGIEWRLKEVTALIEIAYVELGNAEDSNLKGTSNNLFYEAR